MSGNIGDVNVWVCPSGHRLVAQHEDFGTTPMLMACREEGCDNTALSSFYQADFLPGEITWVWRKATSTEKDLYEKNWPEMFHHIQMGGLVIDRKK